MFSQKKNNEEGFTLVELLVVILIIGILAAIAIPLFLNQRKSAREAAVKSDLKNAVTQVEGTYSNKDNDGDGNADGYKVVRSVAKGSGEEATVSPGFLNIVASSGNVVESRNIGDKGFCVTGYHVDDPTNVWHLGNGGNEPLNNRAGCGNGSEDGSDDDTTAPGDEAASGQCGPLLKDWSRKDALVHLANTPEYEKVDNLWQLRIIDYDTYRNHPLYQARDAALRLSGDAEMLVWWSSEDAAYEAQDQYMERINDPAYIAADAAFLAESQKYGWMTDNLVASYSPHGPAHDDQGNFLRPIEEIQAQHERVVETAMLRSEALCP